MVTRGSRKEVDRAQADKYRRVGAALLESAQALAELATDSDGYGNAIAVVAVHACIAYNDALSIAWKGVKSTEGDHTRAPDTLLFALSHQAPPERVRQLKMVVAKKDQVSYQGAYYRVSDAARLLGEAAGFCAWAEETYERRPPLAA
ncbi:MAG: hypothetical protein KY467_15180 [Gemmatimonadetes bacterium]|nr:hypothetical protein [Gemmatimonadota bacterium]